MRLLLRPSLPAALSGRSYGAYRSQRSDGPGGSDRPGGSNGSQRSDRPGGSNRSGGSNCSVNICTTRKLP